MDITNQTHLYLVKVERGGLSSHRNHFQISSANYVNHDESIIWPRPLLDFSNNVAIATIHIFPPISIIIDLQN